MDREAFLTGSPYTKNEARAAAGGGGAGIGIGIGIGPAGVVAKCLTARPGPPF